MVQINVVTGFGYIKDIVGNIITKCELPIGRHEIKDGYVYVEVTSKEELDKISVYAPPELTQKLLNEQKIQNEMRQMAIERLKARGEI